jgi:hypothetical protein
MTRQYLRARLALGTCYELSARLVPPGWMQECKPHPREVSPEEWYVAGPYIIWMNKNAPQHRYELRGIFNALHWIVHDLHRDACFSITFHRGKLSTSKRSARSGRSR